MLNEFQLMMASLVAVSVPPEATVPFVRPVTLPLATEPPSGMA